MCMYVCVFIHVYVFTSIEVQCDINVAATLQEKRGQRGEYVYVFTSIDE